MKNEEKYVEVKKEEEEMTERKKRGRKKKEEEKEVKEEEEKEEQQEQKQGQLQEQITKLQTRRKKNKMLQRTSAAYTPCLASSCSCYKRSSLPEMRVVVVVGRSE